MKISPLFLVLNVVLLLTALCAAVEIKDVTINQNSLIPHHTSAYSLEGLDKSFVMRRGFDITFDVTLSEPLPVGASVQLTASSFIHGGDQLELMCKTDWVRAPPPVNVMVFVRTLATAPIGRYRLTAVVVSHDGQPLSRKYSVQDDMIVLFNPYNPDDVTYMDESSLATYLEAEDGLVWQGSLVNHDSRVWHYAQFHSYALAAALHVVETGFKGDRSDPVGVSRFLSLAADAQASFKHGVLIGNWGSTFPGGHEPTWWQGSDEIFREYVVTNKFNPVRYGQCWVFGGVLNTLLRTLGLPSRQLTNFNSAHEEADRSLPYGFRHQIDEYYDESGKLLKQTGMVWNFHSWNDVWMARKLDSGKIERGWQAVDATPQEYSEGALQMGPAPLSQVRARNDPQPYDTPFVISEVGSVVHRWMLPKECQEASDPRCVEKRQDLGEETRAAAKVGGLIRSHEEDITAQYKDEPAREPHTAPNRMPGMLPERTSAHKPPPSRFPPTMVLDVKSTLFGEPILVTVTTGALSTRMQVFVRAYSVNYAGERVRSDADVNSHPVWEREFVMSPNIDAQIERFIVTAKEYLASKLPSGAQHERHFLFSLFAHSINASSSMPVSPVFQSQTISLPFPKIDMELDPSVVLSLTRTPSSSSSSSNTHADEALLSISLAKLFSVSPLRPNTTSAHMSVAFKLSMPNALRDVSALTGVRLYYRARVIEAGVKKVKDLRVTLDREAYEVIHANALNSPPSSLAADQPSLIIATKLPLSLTLPSKFNPSDPSDLARLASASPHIHLIATMECDQFEDLHSYADVIFAP